MSSGGVFDVESLRTRVEELQNESARPELWDNRERAETVLREKSRVERELSTFDDLASSLEDADVLLELAAEADESDAWSEVSQKIEAATRDLEEAEVRRLLGGEHDSAPAIVSINAGAGGTDACDWAEMLLRMYLRWAEYRGYRVEELDRQDGEEAGIRSVTFTVSGDFAYGYLRELGRHPLLGVRRDSAATSLISVPTAKYGTGPGYGPARCAGPPVVALALSRESTGAVTVSQWGGSTGRTFAAVGMRSEVFQRTSKRRSGSSRNSSNAGASGWALASCTENPQSTIAARRTRQ